MQNLDAAMLPTKTERNAGGPSQGSRTAGDSVRSTREHASLIGTISYAKDLAMNGQYEEAAKLLRRAVRCTVALQEQTALF